jgi:hypothetical protein
MLCTAASVFALDVGRELADRKETDLEKLRLGLVANASEVLRLHVAVLLGSALEEFLGRG